jgi:hypothetical protein
MTYNWNRKKVPVNLDLLSLGRRTMVKTITIGSCVSVQGNLVQNLADGRIVVQVGNQRFTGRPVIANA